MILQSIRVYSAGVLVCRKSTAFPILTEFGFVVLVVEPATATARGISGWGGRSVGLLCLLPNGLSESLTVVSAGQVPRTVASSLTPNTGAGRRNQVLLASLTGFYHLTLRFSLEFSSGGWV